MKIRAKVHGKETMKSIRKDYPQAKNNKEAIKILLYDALMSLFKKEKINGL